MRKSAASLSFILISVSLLQSCAPSVKSQCERIVSAHEWIYENMRRHKSVKGRDAEQSDSFYADKIEQNKTYAREGLRHLKVLDIKYSDRTLESNAPSASRKLTLIVQYYENSIKVLEFYGQSEKGLTPDDVGIQEALETALRLEDHLALTDEQEFQLQTLNRMQNYCSRK